MVACAVGASNCAATGYADTISYAVKRRIHMSDKSISMPKSALTGLDLRDADVIEGRAGRDAVELRVVCRGDQANGDMTAERFVAKWLGKFPYVKPGSDPRLDALLRKHVKPE